MSDLFDPTLTRTMKALSLWQPWASLTAAGVKGPETRHWLTAYRGEAAGPVIEAVIAWPAACLAAFRLKAEAVVWAVGGDLVLGPAPTLQERLVDALLRDLLASSAQPDCAPCALEV